MTSDPETIIYFFLNLSLELQGENMTFIIRHVYLPGMCVVSQIDKRHCYERRLLSNANCDGVDFFQLKIKIEKKKFCGKRKKRADRQCSVVQLQYTIRQ